MQRVSLTSSWNAFYLLVLILVFGDSPMMCGVGLRPVFLSGADLKVRRLRGASTERRMRLCRRFHLCRSRSTDIGLKLCVNSFVHCKDVVSG